MGQSDYLTHFLDLADPLLDKKLTPTPAFLSKITSLLELVVRSPSSACYGEPYKEDLAISFCDISLFDQLEKINSMVGIDMKKHLQNMQATEMKFRNTAESLPKELTGITTAKQVSNAVKQQSFESFNV